MAEPVTPTRVVHYRLEPFDISIMRPSVWGNPFVVGVHGDKDTCVRRFRAWVNTSRDQRAVFIREHIERLRGKTLGCACKHRPSDSCHGDVYVEMLEKEMS